MSDEAHRDIFGDEDDVVINKALDEPEYPNKNTPLQEDEGSDGESCVDETPRDKIWIKSETPEPIKIGDVVQLKTGSIHMTVVREKSEEFACVYWGDSEGDFTPVRAFRQYFFPTICLKKV